MGSVDKVSGEKQNEILNDTRIGTVENTDSKVEIK